MKQDDKKAKHEYFEREREKKTQKESPNYMVCMDDKTVLFLAERRKEFLQFVDKRLKCN